MLHVHGLREAYATDFHLDAPPLEPFRPAGGIAEILEACRQWDKDAAACGRKGMTAPTRPAVQRAAALAAAQEAAAPDADEVV